MQSSPLSNSNSADLPHHPEGSRYQSIRLWLAWFCRLAFGATFIFSGFVKAIDPWGTYYKFTEYLSALGIDLVPNLILSGVFGLCALEFLIGIFILLGCYRKSAPLLGLGFMAVMLPITLWIAVSDPVADCGCFGDALILSNWATFWKNVVLTAMILFLLKEERKTYALVTPALQWICVAVSLVYIGVILYNGYFIQPLIDFRPYQVGESLFSSDEDEGPDYVFVYSKNGDTREFGEDDELPSEDDGWEFVERKEIRQSSDSASDSNHEKTFRIWDESGDNDMSEEMVEKDFKLLMLLIPDLATVSPATTWKINELYDIATESGVGMIAAVAGNSQLIREWSDLSMPQYELFMAEDTAIKEVARGNPAVIYIEDGIIKWKSTLTALYIPESTPDASTPRRLPMSNNDTGNLLYRLNILYACILGVLIALSFFPSLRNVFSLKRLSRKQAGLFTDDDKAPHGE